MEKKLRISEEKNEALKNLLGSKDDEMERVLQQKVALTNLFENDLLQMTDKIIAGVKGVRSQEELGQMAGDLQNLQKLIAVSFQALKGSMAQKQARPKAVEKENNVQKQGESKIPQAIDQMLH